MTLITDLSSGKCYFIAKYIIWCIKGVFMATVLSNERLVPGVYRLSVEGDYEGKSGQFYMLRCWDTFPLLSRPISIHDLGAGTITFLFRVNGAGTRLLSKLGPGDSIQLEGPFGN